jgi:hypothetical protein
MAALHASGSLFLHVKVADIADPETDDRFEAMLLNGVTPAIRSAQTGRWCSFDFRELVDLARAEGIDAPAEASA